MECGSTLTRVLYLVPDSLCCCGSVLFASFSSLKRPNIISSLSFISSSNRFVGYCVSTPVCCGLIWLNFILMSKHRSYLNVSIFQEEITLLSLWNGKTVVIFISLVLHSELYYQKVTTNDWYLLRQEFRLSYHRNNRSRKSKTNRTQPHPPEPYKLENISVQNSRLQHS